MSGSSSRSSLLGKWLVISVGEPWEFSSEAGEGVLLGRIAQIKDIKKEWCVRTYECLHFPNNFKTKSGDLLSLSPRYTDGNLENISSAGREMVNATLSKDGDDNYNIHVISGGAALFASCKVMLPEPPPSERKT